MTLEPTFLEWAESLPEDQSWRDSQVAPQRAAAEAIITRFLHSLSHATSVVEINVAAGLAYQALTGVDG